jgi:D-beta-D-heptose 7-phosphate kinase/D-beta-D-heptose 1-phosphate adenosyltransferase
MDLLGLPGVEDGHRGETLLEYGDRLLDATGANIAAVTLDSEGAITFSRGQPPYRTYADRHPRRTAGAGDTFVSLLALGLAAGLGVPQTSELASAAAAIVIVKPETASCSPAELMAYTSGAEKLVSDEGVLQVSLDFERQSGRRIVFTNGCFDIIHAGHIAFLNNAKAAGDVLVVGLNSDTSVSRIKGPSRPINGVDDRARVLAAMSCVDYIIVFEDDSPVEAIKRIRPDVFVKGGDYTREMLPEAALVEALGGRVQIMPYVEDRSTTGIIRRVREREALVQ